MGKDGVAPTIGVQDIHKRSPRIRDHDSEKNVDRLRAGIVSRVIRVIILPEPLILFDSTGRYQPLDCDLLA
jgi:hypothetical protein